MSLPPVTPLGALIAVIVGTVVFTIFLVSGVLVFRFFYKRLIRKP